MKCSDFMIGDWMQDDHNFPMKVTCVGEDYLYADFEGNQGDVLEFDDKDDIPCGIPLTEEILTKNGFNSTGSKDYSWCLLYDNQDNGIRYNLYVGLQEKNIEMIVTHYVTEEGRIRRRYNEIDLQLCEHSVHEFQQALRLAGLKELANNFKI